MVIRKEDRLAAVLRQDPSLVDALKALSPAFERLDGGDGRGVVSRLVTVEQAAQMAGMDADELVTRLNAGYAGEEPRPLSVKKPEAEASRPPAEGRAPAALQRIPRDRIVEVDVRDELRAGREPFSMIMATRRDVPEGGGFVVRAIFEPVPLYAVMGKQGFAHYTERIADDDWKVWFFRAPSDESPAGPPSLPGAEPAAAEDGGGGPAAAEDAAQGLAAAERADARPGAVGDADGVRVLDVRGLEPPEPMVRTLAALETLPQGETLLHINVRVPRFLLPQLEERGYTYEIREQAPDLVRVFIRRAPHGAGPQPQLENQAMPAERTLDVRAIPPREKHPTIFTTFASLEPGESFVLVNDHDPQPLRYQFEFEHRGEFGWEYLEEGPSVWRVEISREAR